VTTPEENPFSPKSKNKNCRNISKTIFINTVGTFNVTLPKNIKWNIAEASTIRLLAKIDKLYPLAKTIHIVLDNARYYHRHEVREWLA
jgi:hypothetical protein